MRGGRVRNQKRACYISKQDFLNTWICVVITYKFKYCTYTHHP